MNATENDSPPTSPPRRWPLILIAAPAAVSIWSGWVGLGGLCGFGIVHPLPGIITALRLNTAITLPIGVEAYGAYALGAWMHPGTPRRARRFARRSAVSALLLGMAGQIIYHLLAAAHSVRAPWPVVVLVSCIPVITLGFGAGLTHLLRLTDPADRDAPELPAEPAEPPGPEVPEADADAVEAARRALAASVVAGRPLSQRQIMTRFRITRAEERELRQPLVVAGAGSDTRTVPATLNGSAGA